MTTNLSPLPPLDGATPLTDWGLIHAQGRDASAFLHGQLTQDLALLRPNQARLAAYLSPKGRMLASFIIVKRSDSDILLACHRSVLAAALKRLSLFVLRAQVTLHDASEQFALWGIMGDAITSIATNALPAWARADFDAAHLIGLYPAGDQARALWIAPADAPAPAGARLERSLWDCAEVYSGVATVTAALADAFVPQMLNYESVGAVSFKKGCYPGQEIVARSQFRGTLKRRTYLLQSSAPLVVGQELFAPGDTEQAVGSILQCAQTPDGLWVALAVLQTSALPGPLQAGSAQGPRVEILPLPYPLLDDI